MEIPRDALTVITGLSGSGRVSKLAFDTIYADGQRRYVESSPPMPGCSWDRWKKPDVDYIEGLSPHFHRPEDHLEIPFHRRHRN